MGRSEFVFDGSPLQRPDDMKYALMYRGIKREIPTEDALNPPHIRILSSEERVRRQTSLQNLPDSPIRYQHL